MAIFNLASFQDKIRIADYTLSLGENLVSSQSGGGVITVSSVGPRLWSGTISITPQTHETAFAMISLVRQIQTAGNYFQFSPPLNAFPPGDPTGSILGSNTPTLTSPVPGYSLTIGGLPAAYKLAGGTLISYGLSGAQRLHQIAADATANASGVITVSLVNPIRVNAVPANGTAVSIKRPQLTCRYYPGSFKAGAVLPGHAEGCSFDFIQTMVTT